MLSTDDELPLARNELSKKNTQLKGLLCISVSISYLSSAGGGVGGADSTIGGSGSFGISGSFILRALSTAFLVFLLIQDRLLVGGGVFGAVGRGTGSGLGGGCRGLGSRLLFSSLSVPLVGILPRDMEFF